MGLVRRVAGVAVVLAVVAGWVVLGGARLHTDATTASLLPGNDPALTATNEAAQYFGGDPVVVLLENPKAGAFFGEDALTALVGLEGSLSRIPNVTVVYGPGTLLNQVAASAQNLIASISGRRDLLSTEATQKATARGLTGKRLDRAVQKALHAFDVRYGSLLVRGLPAGLPTLRNPDFVKTVAFGSDGSPRPEWRFVVPSSSAVAVLIRPRADLNQAQTEQLVRRIDATVHRSLGGSKVPATKVTIAGLPSVAADLGHEVRREVPIVGALGLGVIALCYLFVPWLRPRRRRLLPIAATLVATAVTLAAFGWLGHPLSLGVVAFLPILVGTGSDFPAYLAWGADRRRVLVTALAAATGFFALAISPVPFVRDLGLSLGAGVIVACAVGLGLATLTRRRDADVAPTITVRAPVRAPVRATASSQEPAPRRAAWLALLAAVTLVAGIGWVGLSSLRVDTQPEHLARGLTSLRDATHAERVLGSAGEVGIFVRANDVLSPESLAWMRKAQTVVVRDFGDRLKPVVSPPSLLSFLGTDPTADQIRAGLAQLPDYLSRAVVRPDGRQAVLTFGIGLGDVATQARLLHRVETALPPPPKGTRVDLVGLPVITARGYQLAFGDRYLAGLAGIGAAALVLLIGLRRRADAFRAAAAALLATGWSLAGASVLHVALTPLTLALGSLATATACEFSVLLADVRADQRGGLRRSILVAALASTAGYLTLSASSLAVIRDFGVFLAVTVLLSLLSARLVLAAFPAAPHHEKVNDENRFDQGVVADPPDHGDRGEPGGVVGVGSGGRTGGR